MAAIRDAHPQATITWVINPEWAPLLRGNRDVDHIHVFPRGDFQGLGAPGSFFSWLKRTRTLRPDLALDFQGLLRSALIAKFSRARVIYGMSDAREGSRLFYDRVAKVERRAHAVERYLQLAEECGASVGERLRCPFPTGDPLPRFDEDEPFVLLHPFARGGGKSLSNQVIEEFCSMLAPARVILVGKSSRVLDLPGNCFQLTNQTTLLQLIYLLRKAKFTVTTDSGPMHIAAAISGQLLSIHMRTDPRRVGPYNSDAWIWRGGQILRVDELETVRRLKRGRRFRVSDLEQILPLVEDALGIESNAVHT